MHGTQVSPDWLILSIRAPVGCVRITRHPIEAAERDLQAAKSAIARWSVGCKASCGSLPPGRFPRVQVPKSCSSATTPSGPSLVRPDLGAQRAIHSQAGHGGHRRGEPEGRDPGVLPARSCPARSADSVRELPPSSLTARRWANLNPTRNQSRADPWRGGTRSAGSMRSCRLGRVGPAGHERRQTAVVPA